jgi:hypothetical protein
MPQFASHPNAANAHPLIYRMRPFRMITMILRYRNTLQDFTDRRKKLRPHDDGRETVFQLMKGLIVVTASLFILWLFLGAA